MIGKRAYPFRVVDFTPFQVTRLSLEDYIEKRCLFSTQDWIDLLIQTVDSAGELPQVHQASHCVTQSRSLEVQ